MPCTDLDGLAGSPEVCEVGGGGLILPLFGDSEQQWDNTLRVILYLVGLLWCFLGVAIIADVFMGAIEKITSKKVRVFDKQMSKARTVTVWNPTVANLTLMALGSSAPEILLNVIAVFPTFQSSDLGPSTIVGSAAFNLLCISAVCVLAIPNGEIRKIKDMGVFGCTCFFSIFAYIWLLIILILPPSKDVVTTYEGVITFVFFWALVIAAFLFDKGMIPGLPKPKDRMPPLQEQSPEEWAKLHVEIHKKYGVHAKGGLNAEQVAALIEYEYFAPKSRAQHRVHATRSMSGGRKVLGASKYETGAELAKDILSRVSLGAKPSQNSISAPTGSIDFKAYRYAVLESVGTVQVGVCLYSTPPGGQLARAWYETRGGTAVQHADYEPQEGLIELCGNNAEMKIPIKIVESKGVAEDIEEFYIDLFEYSEANKSKGRLISTATIVIIDEDLPGQLCFETEQLVVPASEADVEVTVRVKRIGGTTGPVSCQVHSEDGNAIAGSDYKAVDQVLEFDDGQYEAKFKVEILANGRYERTEEFRLVLTDPKGTSFDRTTDGGNESCILTVVIAVADESKGRIDQLLSHVAVNWGAISIGNANYKEQFTSAVFCGGSLESQKEATPAECGMHVVSLPWKLLFAIVPPVEYAGGWLCFCCALLMIGFVTVIIGDLAELLGCTLGIPASTTAITLVALGTSLPDTFASKTAAQMDPYADNSIGNITGSNSVNVFLGLGLPWMIQAIYWEFIAECVPGDEWYLRYADMPHVFEDFPTGAFVVPAGSLTASVAAFCVCAVVCVAVLMLRRHLLGGELGGPKVPAYCTAIGFVALWIAYIVSSILLGD
eukprot:CAMPEP_0206604860 /NCGR_PEP_ID=MMETSP0325_2-20121206/49863_1 /ASSEMBLY_ACC=CAM_ASM_000347 /TAXON_ID=2866 /ORGANISM="Crypthecodinium cohnii, Strain Seligo" /LENGTH=831 /DNA_ID=CAMNT_0054119877 /DNA_START=109 /DNA_END=2604 /DNA_ORIENTATION=-